MDWEIMMNRETGEILPIEEAKKREGTWENRQADTLLLEITDGKITYDIAAD